MPLGTDYAGQACSLARTLEVVGERWTLLILRDLFFGVRRFSDLQRHLDVPRAVLSARIATLVEGGLVERRPYRPGRDELLLTERGEELCPRSTRSCSGASATTARAAPGACSSTSRAARSSARPATAPRAGACPARPSWRCAPARAPGRPRATMPSPSRSGSHAAC